MADEIVDGFVSAFRPYVVDGVPSSGAHKPVKPEVQALGQTIQEEIDDVRATSAAGLSGGKTSRAALYADLDWPEDTLFKVAGDPDSELDGVYRKSGASGAGSWAPYADPTFAAAAAAAASADTADEKATIATEAVADVETLVAGVNERLTLTYVPGVGWAFADPSGASVFTLALDGSINNADFNAVKANALLGAELSERFQFVAVPGVGVALTGPDGSAYAVFQYDGTLLNKTVADLRSDLEGLSTAGLEQQIGEADSTVLAFAALPHLLIYGQSLSMGALGQPVISTAPRAYAKKFVGGVRTRDGAANYTAHYAALTDLTETAVSIHGETIASAMADTIKALLLQEDGIDLGAAGGVTPLFSAPGEDGQSAAGLSDGTPYFTRLKADIDAGKARADASYDGSYQLLAMPYLQGEQDYSLGTAPATWRAEVLGIRSDAEAYGQSVSGLTRSLPMVVYQMACHVARSSDPTLALEALDMARDEAMVGLATPTYFFDFVDGFHMTNESYYFLGCYFGWLVKRWCFDGRKIPPLAPVEAVWHAKGVMLRFEPSGQLAFDTTRVADPGDYGFELVSADGLTTYATAVTLRGTDWVEIRSTTTISAGAKLRYAWSTDDPTNGEDFSGRIYGARGCLRDTQGDRLSMTSPTGAALPLHRWAPIFEEIRP